MKKVIAGGIQSFEKLRQNDYFYVDKTDFIREWWDNADDVTLITRPRRFGKTLNMSMMECFFSNRYADRPELFENLSVWNHEEIRKQQGKWPVLPVTFAGVKGETYSDAITQIKKQLASVALNYSFLKKSEHLEDEEIRAVARISDDMTDQDAAYA